MSVLWRLGNAGLKFQPSKFQLFCWEVAFLGHVVSGQGIATDPEKIWMVQDLPPPACMEEVRSFVPSFVTVRPLSTS